MVVFLISAHNVDCGCTLDPPRWGDSNEHPQSIFGVEMKQISHFVHLKIFIFTAVKITQTLQRRFTVMVHTSF